MFSSKNTWMEQAYEKLHKKTTKLNFNFRKSSSMSDYYIDGLRNLRTGAIIKINLSISQGLNKKFWSKCGWDFFLEEIVFRDTCYVFKVIPIHSLHMLNNKMKRVVGIGNNEMKSICIIHSEDECCMKTNVLNTLYDEEYQ